MFNWIAIGGIIQVCALVVFLIGTERGNKKANIILSVYLLALGCYILFPTLLRSYDWAVKYFLGTGFAILFFIGPLLFFYINYLFKESISLKKITLHLLVAIFAIIYLAPLYLSSPEEKVYKFNYVRDNGLPIGYSILWTVACIHVILYTGFVFFKTFQYNRDLKNTYSKIDKINLYWVTKFSLMNFVLWSVYLAAYVLTLLKIEIDPLGVIDQGFNAILSIFVFYIGYVAMSRPEVFPSATIVPVFRKSSLLKENSEKRRENIKKLEQIMAKERPYIIPELTLNELANISGIPARKLTSIINQEYEMNFYNYINKYGVEDFKKRIVDKNNDQFTILAIARDSGFNSKSTFNDVFKKFERTTPSEYKKRMQL